MPPGVLVGWEVLRALAALAVLPVHAAGYWLRRTSLREAVRADLETRPEFGSQGGHLELPARPLRIFVSCAEASGETHTLNLLKELRALCAEHASPAPELVGFGGKGLEAAGVRILGDPVARAAMGFSGLFGSLPFYLGLVRRAAEEFQSGEIDLFLPTDSPALHLPLGHLARGAGVPVVHFVTPQYWGWAPWRVGGYRRAIDLALSILPFEPAWFARHRVEVRHVGHPLLDELRDVPPSHDESSGTLVLLPGSRERVIERNLPVMLAAWRAAREQGAPGNALVAQSDERHRERIEALIEEHAPDGGVSVAFGNLDRTLAGAGVAFSVSGTALLHLLHHRLPAVVLYRLEHGYQQWMTRHFLTTPWFASVNLLAGRELYPEFSFAGSDPPPGLVNALGRALKDPVWRARCVEGLEAAADRLGPPGATARAAHAALARILPPESPR